MKFYNHYSSSMKLLHIIGWILRFCANSRKVNEHRTSGLLINDDLHRAEIVLLKLVQQDSFEEPFENKLKTLQTITDSDDLLRLKNKVFLQDDTINFRYPQITMS